MLSYARQGSGKLHCCAVLCCARQGSGKLYVVVCCAMLCCARQGVRKLYWCAVLSCAMLVCVV